MRANWLGLIVFASLGCHASFEAEAEQAQSDGQWHVQCPESTRWNGEVCMWRYVITDVTCPKMAVWDGTRCISTHVTCPDGAAWDGDACVPVGQRPVASQDEEEEPLPAERKPKVFKYR